MDGVLFDSMKYHAEAWVQALNQVGLPFTVYEAYMNEGRTGASTIDGVFMKSMIAKPVRMKNKLYII
jgi:beta-phosphoglucomutase-like phosphatase (HAD superfamily)